MKKVIFVTLMLIAVCSYATYNVGATVMAKDNLPWTINGPTGDPEVGNSSDIFTKISEGKAVFLFMGQTW